MKNLNLPAGEIAPRKGKTKQEVRETTVHDITELPGKSVEREKKERKKTGS